MIKYTTTFILLLLSPYIHSMELDLAPLLEKENASVAQKKGFFADNYKPAGYGYLPEKLYLARRLPGLLSSKIVRKKIIEYMLQAESHLNYEIALHYQTKIDASHNRMNALASEKKSCPDIVVDFDASVDRTYRAIGAGCCGALSGATVECIGLMIQSYSWLFCGVSHNPIVWKALAWSCPACTCSGCLIGSCCVLSGLSDKIKCV